MSTELVSIVIPCYQGAAFLAEAIESCLRQTYRQLEIIVVDDASPDSCAAIAERYVSQDHRVRLLRRATNGGVARAFNTGFANAAGAYHTRLAQDDVFREDAIAVMVHALRETPSAALVYCDYQIMNEAGTCQGRVHVPLPEEALRWQNRIGLCVMWRRTIWEELGGFDPDFDTVEDFDFWLRLAQHHPIIRCTQHAPLFVRRHPQMGSLRQAFRQWEATACLLRRSLAYPQFSFRRYCHLQKGLAYVAFGTAADLMTAGASFAALWQMLYSFLRWPLPYRRSEVRTRLARPKLLARTMLDLLGCWNGLQMHSRSKP